MRFICIYYRTDNKKDIILKYKFQNHSFCWGCSELINPSSVQTRILYVKGCKKYFYQIGVSVYVYSILAYR